RPNSAATCQAHVNDEPQNPAKLRPSIPRDLAAVVLRCLAKHPDNRYASAADLEAALLACACATSWTATRAATWWKEKDTKDAPAKTPSGPQSGDATADAGALADPTSPE